MGNFRSSAASGAGAGEPRRGGARAAAAAAQAKARAALFHAAEKERQARIRKQEEAIRNVANYVFGYAPVTILLKGRRHGAEAGAQLGDSPDAGLDDDTAVDAPDGPCMDDKDPAHVGFSAGGVWGAAGKKYLWICIDHSKVEQTAQGIAATAAYPPGAAIDAEGNVYIPAHDGFPDLVMLHSDLIHAFSLPVVGKAPLLVEATPTSLTLRWSPPVVTVDKCELQMRPSDRGGRGAPVKGGTGGPETTQAAESHWRTISTEVTGAEYTLVELHTATAYDVRVRAHNHAGWGAWSPPAMRCCTSAAAPERPARPYVASRASGGVVSLAWEAPEDNGAPIQQYHLRCRVAGGNDRDWVIVWVGSGVSVDGDVCGLRPGTIYQCAVRATNAEGEGDWSPLLTFKTGGDPSCGYLGGLTREQRLEVLSGGLGPLCAAAHSGLCPIVRRKGNWVARSDPERDKLFYENVASGVVTWAPPACFLAVESRGAFPEVRNAPGSPIGRGLPEGSDGGSVVNSDGSGSGALDARQVGPVGFSLPGTPESETPRERTGSATHRFRSSSSPAEVVPVGAAPRGAPSRSRALQRPLVGSVGSPRLPSNAHGASAVRRMGSLRLTPPRGVAGALPGGAASPALSAARPGTPTGPVAADSAEGLFRKKRYRFLRNLRLRAAAECPGARGAAHLRASGGGARGVVPLLLDRNRLFAQSFAWLRSASTSDLRKKLRIEYRGEEGIDAGGLTKDWYLQMGRALLNPSYCLFARVEGDDERYVINPLSEAADPVGQDVGCDEAFRVVGRFLGKALFDVQVVDMPLADLLLKHLVGDAVGFDDLVELDPVYAKSLKWLLDNDITDIVDECFVVSRVAFGALVDVELLPGGADIEVTDDNKGEYVELVTAWRTEGAFRKQLVALRAGFHEVVPVDELAEFSVDEVNLMFNGVPDVDVLELRKSAKLAGGFADTDEVVQWFWRALASFSSQERRAVLCFITGTTRVPLDGFDPPLTLVPGADDGMGATALPRAHSCFNSITLPPYESLAVLADKLLFAANNTDGFLLS